MNIYMALIRYVYFYTYALNFVCFLNKTCFIPNTVNDSFCFKLENVFRTFLNQLLFCFYRWLSLKTVG